MPARLNLAGFRSGRLVAVKPVGKGVQGRVQWECRCDCGGTAVVPSSNLTMKRGTKSCGCLGREAAARRTKGKRPWNAGKTYAINGGEREYTQKQNWAKAVLRAKGNRCEKCGWSEARCDVHHIVPRSQGGRNVISNGVALCPNHHRLLHGEHE
jgi:5-methylcytosine-specific restriction endonuclease McrA